MTIKKQAVSGVKWTTVSTVVLTVVSMINISILTRFLDKSDFGLIALVMIVLGFTGLFVDLGITIAILHKQEISKKEYSSLYWLNLVFSLIIYLCAVLIAPVVASYYKEPLLSTLIPLMSVRLLITAVGRQFRTIQQKELRFKTISIIDIVASVFSLILATYLAYKGFGVYSLIYSALLHDLLTNVIFFVIGIKKYGLQFHYAFSDAKPFLKIGLYSVGGLVANYFSRDLDTLIIGKLFGVEILGGYNLVRQLARSPLKIIDPIITRVTMSIFPKFQNDTSKLSHYIVSVLKKLSIVNALVYGSMALLAPLVLKMLYGENYTDLANMLRLMVIISFLRSIGAQISPLIIATGKTGLGFIWNIIVLLLVPAVVLITARYGAYYVVVGMVVTQFLLVIPVWRFFYYRLIKLSTYLLSFMPALVIASVVTGLLLLFSSDNLLYQLIYSVILACSLLIYGLLTDREIVSFKNEILNRIRR